MRDLPCSSAYPARCQPMVPFFSATTRLGIPALINDWDPIMLRVRPAQFTTTSVSGCATISGTRYTNSAPGQQIAPGILILKNSCSGRLSSTTMSSPASIFPFSSSAGKWGVPYSCSTNSPKALLGTFTPENSS